VNALAAIDCECHSAEAIRASLGIAADFSDDEEDEMNNEEK
jgi:hypothetical protein